MKLTRDQVLHIARLARLKLSDTEVEIYTSQLGSILEYMEVLHEVDTSDVEPTFQVTGLQNVTVDDEIAKKCNRDELLKCSPLLIEKDQIKVKAVKE